MSFIPDRIDRHAFDVQFEQELEQAVNSGLVRNYSHEMRVAIGAIAGVKSVDSREDGRAQYSADDYLEFFGGQRMPFQYYASRGERNESQCLRWTRLLAELTTKQAVPIARMHGCTDARSLQLKEYPHHRQRHRRVGISTQGTIAPTLWRNCRLDRS